MVTLAELNGEHLGNQPIFLLGLRNSFSTFNNPVATFLFDYFFLHQIDLSYELSKVCRWIQHDPGLLCIDILCFTLYRYFMFQYYKPLPWGIQYVVIYTVVLPHLLFCFLWF